MTIGLLQKPKRVPRRRLHPCPLLRGVCLAVQRHLPPPHLVVRGQSHPMLAVQGAAARRDLTPTSADLPETVGRPVVHSVSCWSLSGSPTLWKWLRRGVKGPRLRLGRLAHGPGKARCVGTTTDDYPVYRPRALSRHTRGTGKASLTCLDEILLPRLDLERLVLGQPREAGPILLAIWER